MGVDVYRKAVIWQKNCAGWLFLAFAVSVVNVVNAR